MYHTTCNSQMQHDGSFYLFMQTDWNDKTLLASNTYHENLTNYNSRVNFRKVFSFKQQAQ